MKLLQASILLVFDVFAEHRAHRYTRWLSGIAQAAPHPNPLPPGEGGA